MENEHDILAVARKYVDDDTFYRASFQRLGLQRRANDNKKRAFADAVLLRQSRAIEVLRTAINSVTTQYGGYFGKDFKHIFRDALAECERITKGESQ